MSGPHDDKESVNGALEFMWKHYEHLVNSAIWTWRIAVAKKFDAYTKGTFVKYF